MDKQELTFEEIGKLVGVTRQRAWELMPPGCDRSPEGIALVFSEFAKKRLLQASELQEIAMKYQEAARKARSLAQEVKQ